MAGIPNNFKEPYTKVPLHLFEAALELDKLRQRQEFIYAAISYMLTGEYPMLTKATKPLFKKFICDFDLMISGFVYGGRTNGTVDLMPGATVQEKFWNQNRSIISMHNSDSNQHLPGQYVPTTAPVPNQYSHEYCGEYSNLDNAATSGNNSKTLRGSLGGALEGKYNTNTNIKDNSPRVGVAVEPPTRGQVEEMFNSVFNDPAAADAFYEYGSDNGWEIPCINERNGLIRAAIAWNTKRLSSSNDDAE